MASSISSAVAKAGKLAPSGLTKTFETVHVPMLPSLDGTGWGRDCRIKKLNVQEQIALLGRVQDGVALDAKNRKAGDPSARGSDDESAQFWESVHLLALGCVDPIFTEQDAVEWITLDEIEGINCGDVVQLLLVHIRGLNDEQAGLEDLAAGLSIIRKMPLALQAIEQAWDKGGNALDLLLEGKAPQSQEEMTAFLEKWGGIISHVVLRSIRKRARIEAEMTADALAAKAVDLLLELGYVEKIGGVAEGNG